MGHRINEWIARLLVPVCVVATMAFLHLGFSVRLTLALLLTLFGVLTFAMIVVDPGPRTKGFVEGLNSRLR
jgi:heme A synthase